MKISHKPLRSKTTKGLGQKRITDFKTKEKYREEIKELQDRRYRYYLDFVKALQLIELDYKTKKNQTTYKNFETVKQSIDNEYYQKRTNEVQTYNELVKPIDKQLKMLRIEILKHYPTSVRKIDERLKNVN